jgi:hypothetical protein
MHQRADDGVRSGGDQRLKVDRADQRVVCVDDEQRARQTGLTISYACETFRHVGVRGDVERLDFHQRRG